MSVVLCQSCLEVACDPLDDMALYSLDTTLYPAVSNCPPGVQCFQPGATIILPCCENEIRRTVPTTATIDEWLAIISEMLAECGTQPAFCTGVVQPPQTPPEPVIVYFNTQACCDSFCPDGSKFTYCVPAGIIVSTSLAQANRYAGAYACRQAKLHKICLSNIPSPCCANSVYSADIAATGQMGQYPQQNFWALVDGNLPTGLTFNGGWLNIGAKATITGTPTVGGNFGFSIRVIAPDGCMMTKNYTLCVIDQTSTPAGPDAVHMPNGVVGTLYTTTLSTDGCATPPLSWQVKPGDSLPPGLTLNESTGVVSGTPTTAGSYTFTIILQTEAS